MTGSQRVILLNGPAGVGKTTVGRLLACLVPNGACIHGDTLKEFVVTRVDGAVAGGHGYVNGAAVAANFIAAGYDLAVFEFVFEHPAHIARFLDAFTTAVPVHLFTLWAAWETVIARERARPDREPLGDRVRACYDVIAQHGDALGYRIDTERMTAEVTARAIMTLAKAGIGLIERGYGNSVQ